ncbi:MAG: metalloregulator ArsR/SmtB family transcription factor [Woeseiaceae bacterium]|nr:metalloregulator ArsR/SmtB family transcription factor [Woeseiaceae bacterium]
MDSRTEILLQRLKTLGDATRLRLLALCRQGECSVSELTRVLGQSQPRVSQQLKLLCEAGLLRRFRDGKRVYYRVPASGRHIEELKELLSLIPSADPTLLADLRALQRMRGQDIDHSAGEAVVHQSDRALHKALVELTVTTPVGDLLDVGCGRGSILKLLASRARRAVGVDIDARARGLARAELMLAGLPNCTLRQGDMYRLPFDDREFNTIVLDDVLADASDPVQVLLESSRLLKTGGRLLILQAVDGDSAGAIQKSLAEWSAAAGLRLAPAHVIPATAPVWLLSVATRADSRDAAA